MLDHCRLVRRRYWLWFVERWAVWGEGGGHGITGPRLRKLYETIMSDDSFWQDIILRHGNYPSPGELQRDDPYQYDHCLNNFWGMIYGMMVERKMLRSAWAR